MAERLSQRDVTRRAVLRAGAVGVVAIGAGGAAWFAFGREGDPPKPVDTAGLPALDRGVVRIGEHYLARYPEETEQRLRSYVPAASLAAVRAPEVAFAALGDTVRADCAAGHTVVVDGWVLARSEAALAGLCTIEARSGRLRSQRRG